MARRKKSHSARRSTKPRNRSFEALEDRRMMAVVVEQSVFSPQTFGDNIDAIFGPNAIGYGWAVNYNGEALADWGGGGNARTSADAPQLVFDETTEMEIASVSKPITAVALVHLIQTQIEDGTFSTQDAELQLMIDSAATIQDKVSLALETKLAEYVPTGWITGVNNAEVTLRHLLTHSSGFVEGDAGDSDPNNDDNGTTHNFNSFGQNTWANLRDLYEVPLSPPDETYGSTGGAKWSYSYNNANFTILAKIVIPKLLDQGIAVDLGDAITDEGKALDPSEVDEYTGTEYSNYVRQNIFVPRGLFGVSLDRDTTPDDDVRAYNTTDPANTNGGVMSNLLNTGGAFGWKMSAEELAILIDAIQHDDSLLDPAVRGMMFIQGLGFTSGNDEFGDNFGHGGQQRRNGDQEFRTQIGFLPGDVQVALLMNSEDEALPYGSLNDDDVLVGNIAESLKVAYKHAWTDVTYAGTSGSDVFEIRLGDDNGNETVEIWMGSGGSPLTMVFSHWSDTLYSLKIDGLEGNDEFSVVEWPVGLDLTFNGDAGNDTYYAAQLSGNLESDNGVVFNGGEDTDTVILNDTINNNPFDHAHTYFIGQDQVSRKGGAPGSTFDVYLYFSDVENSTLHTSVSPFDDFVEVLSTGGSTTINTYLGDDSVEVAGSFANLDVIGDLNIDFGDGNDSLKVYDQNNNNAGPQYHYYSVSDDHLERLGFSQDEPGNTVNVTIDYDNVESLELRTSNLDDEVAVASIPELGATIYLGEGDDTVATTSGNLEDVDELVIIGGKGEDAAFLGDTTNPYTADFAHIYEVSSSQVRRDGGDQEANHGIPINVNVDYEQLEHLSLSSGKKNEIFYVSGGGAWTTDLMLGEGDDIVFGSPVEQNIEFIDGLTVHGEQGRDQLILNDAHNPYSHLLSNRYEVAEDHVSRFRDVHGPGETHMPPGTNPADAVDVLVQMESVELLDLTTGDQGDVVEVISSTSQGTTLDTHSGNDVIVTTSGDLADVDGLVVESNVGEDTLILDDAANPYQKQYSDTYFLESGVVYRDIEGPFVLGAGDPVSVEYAGVENLELHSGNEADNINVSRGGLLTTLVEAGGGDDIVNVSPTSKNLQLVPGLTVDGGADADRVVLNDANNPYINNYGHLYTVDQQQVHRQGGVFLQLTPIDVEVNYENIESLELETGTQDEIIHIQGTGSDASLAVRAGSGPDRIHVHGEAFAQIDVHGDNPTHYPGDVLNLIAPVGVASYHHPDPKQYGAGTASIGASYITYAGIEEAQTENFTKSNPNLDKGDFDGDGVVDGDDLTNPILGGEALFGKELNGTHFMSWLRNFGTKVEDDNKIVLPVAAQESESEDSAQQPLVAGLAMDPTSAISSSSVSTVFEIHDMEDGSTEQFEPALAVYSANESYEQSSAPVATITEASSGQAEEEAWQLAFDGWDSMDRYSL